MSKMSIERFEKGLGVDIETFIEIITDGFYYIKDNDIYWCGNNAIYIGNGYSNSMVKTHHTIFDINKVTTHKEDCHYWDWKKKGDVFDFKDYGKTWSVNREDLEKVVGNE